MAQIIITVADAQAPRAIAGLCGHENLDATAANAKVALVRVAKRAILEYERALREVQDEQALDIT